VMLSPLDSNLMVESLIHCAIEVIKNCTMSVIVVHSI
jgi:hypothetical protein